MHGENKQVETHTAGTSPSVTFTILPHSASFTLSSPRHRPLGSFFLPFTFFLLEDPAEVDDSFSPWLIQTRPSAQPAASVPVEEKANDVTNGGDLDIPGANGVVDAT